MLQVVEEIHYDYTKQMMAVVRRQMDTDTGVRDNVTVIFDYKNVRMPEQWAGAIDHTFFYLFQNPSRVFPIIVC